MPAPGIGAHIGKRLLGGPVKFPLGFRGIGKTLGNITGAAGGKLIRDRAAGGSSKSGDNFQNADSFAGTEVVDDQAGIGGQFVDGFDMADGQVDDMDIVTDAGTVGGGVVVTKNLEMLKFADGHLGNIREEIVGNTLRVFADQSGRMGADGVEVTEDGNVPGRIGGM